MFQMIGPRLKSTSDALRFNLRMIKLAFGYVVNLVDHKSTYRRKIKR
jgi:hypothetical protein